MAKLNKILLFLILSNLFFVDVFAFTCSINGVSYSVTGSSASKVYSNLQRCEQKKKDECLNNNSIGSLGAGLNLSANMMNAGAGNLNQVNENKCTLEGKVKCCEILINNSRK